MALGVGLGLVGGPTWADEISDTRSEAARIADRMEELQHEAEVLTEQYLDAKLAREQLDERITDARGRAERSRADAAVLEDDLREFAVEVYVSGGGGGIDLATAAVLGASDASEIGRRRGYARSISSDGEDLADQYRGAAATADADTRALEGLLAEAERVEADIADRQADTEARIAELEELEERVTGRLRSLVQAEQERREAERRRRAEEEARRNPPPAPAPAVEEREADEEPSDAPTDDVDAPAPTAPSPEPAPDPEPPAPTGPSSGADAAIAAAHSVLGTPYRWAGASPSGGFDCSGLVLWAWSHGGKSLPHSSKALYAMSRKIPVDQLQPGDLVFYNSPISHVGLYIGGGQMIHAPHTGDVVKISSIHYWSALVGGGRV